jgi:hypothetical protein
MDPIDPLMPFIETLKEGFNGAWDTANKLVRNAYEAGKAAGKQEAAEDLRVRLASVLNVPMNLSPTILPPPPLPPPPGSSTHEAEKRAPRGSVRPAIIGILVVSPNGVTTGEAALLSGVNENSARGTLNTLLSDGIVRKDGGKWYLIPGKELGA